MGGCASMNENGTTVSGNVGAGTKLLPTPVSNHAGGSYTISLTLNDLKQTAERYLQKAFNDLRRIYGPPGQ
jgi:hypothetical protein